MTDPVAVWKLWSQKQGTLATGKKFNDETLKKSEWNFDLREGTYSFNLTLHPWPVMLRNDKEIFLR